jgi:hypothetical protein
MSRLQRTSASGRKANSEHVGCCVRYRRMSGCVVLMVSSSAHDPERSSGPFSINGQVSVSDRLDFVGRTAWKLHSEL